MENLKLHIKSDQSIIVEIPNPSDELKKHIVDGVLSKIALPSFLTAESIVFAEAEHPEDIYTAPLRSFDVSRHIHSDYAKEDEISSEPTPSFAGLLAEDEAKRAARKESDDAASEDFRTTGIKVKNGIKTYKCRYECSNHQCGMKSNHYVWEDTQEVDCHGCGNRLKVRKATQDAELTRDPFGNFYVAGKRKPYHEVNTY